MVLKKDRVCLFGFAAKFQDLFAEDNVLGHYICISQKA